MVVTADVLVVLGVLGLLLVFFQVLQGMRKIKFKGRLHLKVHKWGAAALVVITVLHTLAAMRFLGYI